MPNETKIATNKILAILMSPSVSNLVDKLSRPTEVTITNGEIDVAMQALKCNSIASIESVPDKYQNYKHKQEHNIEQLAHYMGELFKEENNLQQVKQNTAYDKKRLKGNIHKI